MKGAAGILEVTWVEEDVFLKSRTSRCELQQLQQQSSY